MTVGGRVVAPATRNDPPDPADWGLVVRPIFAGIPPIPVVPPATQGVVTVVAASAVPVLLLAANPLRIGFSIRNASNSQLYVKSAAGGVVSPTFNTVELIMNAYYEDPYRYVGDVFGIWDVAVGEALITEYAP